MGEYASQSAPGEGALELEAVDQVDGRFVLRATTREAEGAAREVGADGLEIEVTSGAGDIEPDPYTNRLVLTPKGGEPVRGHAVYGRGGARLVSADSPLGMDVSAIPVPEMVFGQAGGGACAARWELAMQADFDVHVRASVMANVIPLEPETRELHWRYGLYFAHDPVIGLMRLTYNPGRRSKIVLKAEGGNGFFPSRATNELYFLIDFVDLGFRGFNKEPMEQNLSGVEWPPFSTAVLAIERPLKFYDVDNPDRLLMTLMSQDMRLYDYSSLDVEALDATLESDGSLTTRWRVTNQSDELVRSRWFLLGSYDRIESEPAEGTRLLGPRGSGLDQLDVTVRVGARKSILRQSVSLNAVSLTDSIFAGRGQFDYRFTDEENEIL